MKKCTRCREKKSLKEFSLYHGEPKYTCKSCDHDAIVEYSKKPKAMVTEIVCCKCDECKPTSDYGKDKYSKTGFKTKCKSCVREYDLARKLAPKKDPGKEKKCAKCRLTKSTKEFSKSCNNSDGLATYCKDCDRLYALLYAQKTKPAVDEIQCSKCDKWKHTSQFHSRVDSKYGYTSKCKTCTRKDDKERREKFPVIVRASNMVQSMYTAFPYLVKPTVCSMADARCTDKIEGHHDDYRYLHRTRPLCTHHHTTWHALNGHGKHHDLSIEESKKLFPGLYTGVMTIRRQDDGTKAIGYYVSLAEFIIKHRHLDITEVLDGVVDETLINKEVIVKFVH